MAQISFSFSGGFWPISFPLFHGTTRPSALGAVLVAACMNGSFIGGKEPYVDPAARALVHPEPPLLLTGTGHSTAISLRHWATESPRPRAAAATAGWPGQASRRS